MKHFVQKLRQSIVFKTIFTIIVVLVAYSAVLSFIGISEVSDALLQQYSQWAFRTAGISAQAIDPNDIPYFAACGGKGEKYEATLSRLDEMCNTSGATFIYVIVPDRTDYKKITFLFSTMNQGSGYTRFAYGYVRDTTNEEYERKYKKICEERSAAELVVRNKGYIETDPHITAMIPLINTAGQVKAILCVQYQMEELIKVRNSYRFKVLLAMVITTVSIIIALSLRMNAAVLKPIRIICAEATRFAQENVKTGTPLTTMVRNRDDIGVLARSVDQMEMQIHSYVENLTRVTAERERIATELSLAARIQDDMLPSTFPAFPSRDDFDIYASMDPAREIGGDFYNYFLIDEDHLCIVIADVSGKGVPAALFMMASTIVLANNAMMGESPSMIFGKANDAICSTNREEMFVTAWLGILEVSSGRLVAANAGHEYPVLRQGDGTFELIKDRHGFVIGGMEGITYHDYELQLEPGSKLFLYTDGVPEATDAKQELFGTERMVEALNADPGADPAGILDNVKQAVNAFVGKAEQFDDITMVCLEYKGK